MLDYIRQPKPLQKIKCEALFYVFQDRSLSTEVKAGHLIDESL